MRKVLYIAILVVLAILAKRGLDYLRVASRQDDPITRTINQIDRTKYVLTGLDTHFIQTQITMFITTLNRRPTSLQEMVDKDYLKPQGILDPWGHPYKEQWTEKELILTSNGEDNVANTPDDQQHTISIGSY